MSGENEGKLNKILIGNRSVGKGEPCFIIGEIGSNHNNDFDTALALIDAAKQAGCDAVKFQSYSADGLYSKHTPRSSEMEGRSLPNETPYALIKRIQMPIEWHAPLKKHCAKRGILFCSTPFDETFVDILESVQAPFYKIASFELTHYPLLRKVAATGKPVILATGNSELNEVEDALEVLRCAGCSKVALLHCVSAYPAKQNEMNLRCLATLKEAFHCPVGLSDHTEDNTAAIIAVSLGACIIEKHMTLDRKTFGPDHPFAMEPEQMKSLVNSIRLTEAMLGDGRKIVQAGEEENHKIGRRSLVASCDLRPGDVVTDNLIAVKRPGLGLHPKYLELIRGRKILRPIKADKWFTWEHFFRKGEAACSLKK